MVPIPSLFFIGNNGTPLEVVTGITKTVDELESKIVSVLERAGLSSGAEQSSNGLTTSQAVPATAAASTSSTSSNPGDDSEIVCEGNVCYKRPKEGESASAVPAEDTLSPQAQLAHEEKLRRAKELIDKKRLEKEEENARVNELYEYRIAKISQSRLPS